MKCRAFVLSAVVGAVMALTACSPEPMKDGPVTSAPSGQHSLCKNNPNSVWCK